MSKLLPGCIFKHDCCSHRFSPFRYVNMIPSQLWLRSILVVYFFSVRIVWFNTLAPLMIWYQKFIKNAIFSCVFLTAIIVAFVISKDLGAKIGFSDVFARKNEKLSEISCIQDYPPRASAIQKYLARILGYLYQRGIAITEQSVSSCCCASQIWLLWLGPECTFWTLQWFRIFHYKHLWYACIAYSASIQIVNSSGIIID